MATTVDTLLVRLEADMTDLKRSLDKMDKDIKRSTSSGVMAFNKLGMAIKAIAGAVVVQQLGRAGASAVLFAADIEEMQSKSAVVFGAFRGDVVDALSEFGSQVGRSRFELEGMASTLQDTFVPLGFARKEASKLSVEMTKLAVDVASFNNASDVETMQAFQSALVGNHETVRRFGIIITEATLNQELMRMGIEKGTKAATEQQKVMARMNLIINGVTDAQGDAARTADSFANQLKAAQSNTQELSYAIGIALMPMATELLNAFNEITVSILNAGIAMGIFAAEPKKKLELVKNEIASISRALNILDAMAGATDIGGDRAGLIGEIVNKYGDRQGAEERLRQLRNDRVFLEEEIAGIEATSEAAKKAQAEIDANNASTTKAVFDPQKIKDIKKILESTKSPAVQLTEQIALLQSAMGELSGPAREQAVDALAQLQEKLRETDPLYASFKSSVQNMASSVSSAFADMLVSGKFNMQSLANVFENFTRTMIAKALELFVINKILGSIFGIPTTTLGSGATVLGTLATGGAASANRPYLVGERGPELIVPNSASTVMNSNNTRSALGGGDSTTIVQNINISTGVQQTVRAEIRSLMPDIANSAKAAVADSKRRGGSYGRAFA